MTAMRSECSISATPALSIRAPPTPVSVRSGRIFLSAVASPDACRSPEASPAMIRTSRTRDRAWDGDFRGMPGAGKRRKRALDLAHDAQCDGQGFATIVAGDDDRLIAAHR